MRRIGRAYLRMQWRLMANVLGRNLAGRLLGLVIIVMLLFMAAAPWIAPAPPSDWMAKLAAEQNVFEMVIAICWLMGFIIAGASLFEPRQMMHLRHHLAQPLTATDLFRILLLYLQLSLGGALIMLIPLIARAFHAASGSWFAALYAAALAVAAVECAFIGSVALWSGIVTMIRRPFWLIPTAVAIATVATWPGTAARFEPLHLARAALFDGDAIALAGFLAEFTVIVLITRVLYTRGFLVHGLALVDAIATRAPGTGVKRSRPLSPWRAAMRDEIRAQTRSLKLLLIAGIWIIGFTIVLALLAGIDGELDANFLTRFPPIAALVILFAFVPLFILAVAGGNIEWKGDRRGELRILPVRFGTVLAGWAAAGSFLASLPYLGGAAILVILAGRLPGVVDEPWAAYAVLFAPAVALSGAAAAVCREAIPAGTVSKVSLIAFALTIIFATTASATIGIAVWLAVHGGASGAADYVLTVLVWSLILLLMGWSARLEKLEEIDSAG